MRASVGGGPDVEPHKGNTPADLPCETIVLLLRPTDDGELNQHMSEVTQASMSAILDTALKLEQAIAEETQIRRSHAANTVVLKTPFVYHVGWKAASSSPQKCWVRLQQAGNNYH